MFLIHSEMPWRLQNICCPTYVFRTDKEVVARLPETSDKNTLALIGIIYLMFGFISPMGSGKQSYLQ